MCNSSVVVKGVRRVPDNIPMKASEVLNRYNNGRRDFSGECLRGESFKGMNLADADFSEADIRGANFTNAYLRGAKFCGAKAGLQRRWAVFLVAVSLLVSVLLGAASGLAGLLASGMLQPAFIQKTHPIALGVIVFVALAAFFILSIRQGYIPALTTVALSLATAVAIGGIFSGTVRGVGAGSAAVAIFIVVAGALAVIITLTILVARVISGAFVAAVGITVAAMAAARTLVGDKKLEGAMLDALSAVDSWESRAIAGGVAVAAVLLGSYIGWQANGGDEKHSLVRKIAVAFAATGGTSFRNTDLTDANFTATRLKSTDFRGAILIRTLWYQAKRLEFARLGTSYLQDAEVRELVITGDGQNKEYDHLLYLEGINLQGANLVNADFTGSVLKDGTLQGADLTDATLTVANLNETNLRDANLSRAKLKQVQLDGADLTGATLTGAFIEDWGITSTTKLDGVRCDYVFMRLPTKDDPSPCRKPDNCNEEFNDGDFADFIKPIFDTLDLYHNQGVDPRAIAISFKQLAENNPDAELEIVSMEKRGKNLDNLLVRAKTTPNADHSRLNAEYFNTYESLQALPTEALLQRLVEKDNHIRQLSEWVGAAISRPGIYAQTYHHQGDTMPDKSSDISISNVTGSSISGVAGGESTAVAGENLTGVAGGDISGTVTNTINQLSESESPEAPTLEDLLKQLQTAIASQDSGLSEKEQKKALKHLDTIGKLGIDRNNSNLQEMAENALDALPTILQRGTGLMEFLKTHFNVELDEILDNIQNILNF